MTLATEWSAESTEKDVRNAEFTAILAARRFDVMNPPPEPVPIFSLGEEIIATPGNLVAIQAQLKAGKSAAVGALLASTMSPTGDCFGFSSSNLKCGALIHFDTEQSPADHHKSILRALRRAGKTSPPEWLYSYCVTDLPLGRRWELFRFELERAAKIHGTIHAALIDGVADLCPDVNDQKETSELVDELHQLAIRYSTSILCVLHENPGKNDTGKTRGHLGSQLARKAETNLRLEKDGNNVTTIWSEHARNTFIPKDKGPRFAWCSSSLMHVSTDTRAAAKADEKRDVMRAEAAAVFEGVPDGMGISYKQLIDAIEQVTGKKYEGARTTFKNLNKAGVITKNNQGKWTLSKW